jgi:UMF1 family MFS transporter
VHEIGTEQEIHETVDREGNRMSAIGMSVGYGVSMVLLIVIALIVLAMGSDKDYPLAIGIGIVGVWWLVWNLVPLRWLEYRPGPPFPKDVNAITYSWKQIGFTLYRVSKLSHAFKVLLAWLLISDAITTLSSVAILFGRDNLKMPQFQLLIAAILLPLSAMIGSYGWYLIQRRLNLTTRTMIILLSFLYALLPVYGLLGFVAPIGLKNVWEVWMVVVYDGLMLGAIQSFFRVQFSQLLPRTVESELFALYEVTDKGSSWIGGLFAAAITDWTHDLRNTFWLLLVMFLLPIVLIWFVDVKEGKQQAIDFYKVKRGNREA